MIPQPIEVYPDKKLVTARKIGSMGGALVGLISLIMGFMFMATIIFFIMGIGMFILGCLISAYMIYQTPDVNQPLFVFTHEGLWDYSKKGKKRFIAWADYSKAKVWRTKGGAYVLLYGSGKMKRIKFSLAEMDAEHLFDDIEQFLAG